MFSYELINEFKKAKGLKTDVEVMAFFEGMNSGNMSNIKKGNRSLKNEQALFIADECGLNPEWVLVQLEEEKAVRLNAKREADIWHNIAKKISKSVTAAALALIVIFSGLEAKHEPSALST